jgi:hypothetical protein
MAAALPDPGWPRGNCPILLLATTVHRSFHHHRLLPGLRPSSTRRKDVLFNPDSPRLLRTLRRGDRCFSGDRFSMNRPPPPQGACNRRVSQARIAAGTPAPKSASTGSAATRPNPAPTRPQPLAPGLRTRPAPPRAPSPHHYPPVPPERHRQILIFPILPKFNLANP